MDDENTSLLPGSSNTGSGFDPNAVPMLIQCLKSCIATRNKQQQTANIVGRGETASIRGAVAQQALQYLANRSSEDLGNLGMFKETIVNSFGALGQSTRNTSANLYSSSPTAQRIGQGFNSGYNQASSSLTNAYNNSPTAQKMNQGFNQGYGQARNMASQGYGQASAAAGRFGNMASNFFTTRKQGQGGRKKRRTRRHKKR